MELILPALQIMCMRITDVSLGTIRTLMTVKGKKYIAGGIGFVEVTIWVLAISSVFQHLDNTFNIIGYSTGFALGTIIGITIEKKIGSGNLHMQIISMHYADKIADTLRRNKIGVTMLPGEGTRGGVALIVAMITRKRESEVIKMVESIDPEAFIAVQAVDTYRGFITNRK
jgi:uncharacterized protein YebE (UPF0316 family)